MAWYWILNILAIIALIFEFDVEWYYATIIVLIPAFANFMSGRKSMKNES